jgi:hypothetical protein
MILRNQSPDKSKECMNPKKRNSYLNVRFSNATILTLINHISSTAISILLLFCFLLFLISCGKEKKVEIQPPVKESEIVERSFTVVDFEFFYPSLISFFVPSQEVEFKVSFFCPDFSREISVSAYFIKDNQRFTGSITPSSFLCLGDYYEVFRLSFPSDITFGQYIMEISFSSSITDDLPFYIRKNILVSSGFPGFGDIFKTWKSVSSFQITHASDFAFLEEEDKIRFFSVSGTQIVSFDFFPKIVSFSDPKILASTSVPAEKIDAIKVGDTLFIFVHGEKTEVISVSGENAKSFGNIPGTRFIPLSFFEAKNSKIFMNSSCSSFFVVQNSGEAKYLDFKDVICDKYFWLNEKVFFVQQNKLFYFESELTEPIQIQDLGPEFDIIQDENKLYVFKKNCQIIPRKTSVSVITIEGSNISAPEEISFNLPITVGCNFNFSAISKDKVLVYFQISSNFPTLFISADKNGKIEDFSIHSYDKFYFKADGEHYLIFSYGKDNFGNTLGKGVILDRREGKKKFEFSGKFFGNPQDFIFDGNKLLIFSVSSSYLVFFSFEKSRQNQFFTSKKAEAFIIEKFSPDMFFVIFTDSKGCWYDGLCKGAEYFFMKIGDYTLEEKIFSHEFEIGQKFLGVKSKGGYIITIFKNLDKVLLFSR